MKNKVILHAGDYFFGGSGAQVHTLLGSCVSITLWHPKHKIGGMCHFALPENYNPHSHRFNPRFGDDCYRLFKRSVAKHNTMLHEYEAKIFGGGNMYAKHNLFSSLEERIERLPVGEKNVASAVSFLAEEDIELKVAHVGEFGYRKIIFDIESGDVWVKFAAVEHRGDQTSQTGGF
jgi:chemotaxis protein CheD